jgi:hypothetical protein
MKADAITNVVNAFSDNILSIIFGSDLVASGQITERESIVAVIGELAALTPATSKYVAGSETVETTEYAAIRAKVHELGVIVGVDTAAEGETPAVENLIEDAQGLKAMINNVFDELSAEEEVPTFTTITLGSNNSVAYDDETYYYSFVVTTTGQYFLTNTNCNVQVCYTGTYSDGEYRTVYGSYSGQYKLLAGFKYYFLVEAYDEAATFTLSQVVE